ncbi:hypothetical protein BHE97_13030 [Aeromicrobium sp. PE09-221]|uniref:leucine-rich repeat protein n=1 Tax=Aeromicrobium sp. PE09-221 TaxID=1898043 RepID=UPI000B3E7A84|nr:leucine-rich repeat protein [Aeromicrobium sp. PE09-221]OUZ08592.1 hypothetical protein BHE97_13030 [Aeromicrobium sp. PE09-221]
MSDSPRSVSSRAPLSRTRFLRRFIVILTTASLLAGVIGAALVLHGTGSAPVAAAPREAPDERLLEPAVEVQAPVEGPGAGDDSRQPGSDASGGDPAQPGRLLPEGEDPEEAVTMIVVSKPRGLFDFRSTEKRVSDAVVEAASTAGYEHAETSVVRRFENAFTGFAIEAPRWALETVRQSAGVESAFIETVYPAPVKTQDAAFETGPYEYVNGSSLAMTGADRVDEQGEGMLISVIDTGLETGHEAFSGDIDPEEARLDEDGLEGLRDDLGIGNQAAYVSPKVPFAYDYADDDAEVNPPDGDGMYHGTHVAGIAAANGGEQIRGTAPDAQIMVQKVFRDGDGAATDTALLGALDDAAVVLPDVVNMSLGSTAGFSTDSEGLYGSIYAELRAEGVIVNVSAGNSDTAAVNNTSGASLPYVTDPDYGIVGSPASLNDTLAVASVDNAEARPYVRGSDGTRAHYVSAQPTAGGVAVAFSELADGTYPYVDAGVGTSADMRRASQEIADSGTASTETILLVRRGGEEAGERLSFEHKLVNAQGIVDPAAVIFIDDEDNKVLATPAVSSGTIPAALISKAAGEALLAAADRTLTVDSSLLDVAGDHFTMSDFTSAGVTPELELKPDFTAPGGRIYSAVPGGYDWESGTSMSAPQTAGILALVKQHLAQSDEFQDVKESEYSSLASQILMNTAVPIENPRTDGILYTPRVQGAGLVNAPGAMTTPVVLSVEGAPNDSRPSASLGDSSEGTYEFTFEARNFSDAAQKYELDATALSDRIADGLFQKDQVDWTDQGVDITFGGDAEANSLTVPANGSARVSVTITANDAFKEGVKEAVNGTFIDGFVRLNSDTVPDLTVPFVGFYGDWSDAPVFDASIASGEAHIYGSALAKLGDGMPLGVNPLDQQAQDMALLEPEKYVDEDRFVMSPTRYGPSPNQVQPVTGLLRNAEKLTYELIRDEDDASILDRSYSKVAKSYYEPRIDSILYAESRLSPKPVLSAFDAEDTELESGTYTLRQTATSSGPGSATQSVESNIYYDNTPAKVESAELVGSGDDAALSVVLSDDSWIAAVDLQEYAGAGYFHRTVLDDPTSTDDSGKKRYELTIPLSEISESWKYSESEMNRDRELPSTAVLYVWDYGLNASTPLTVTLFESPVSGIEIDQTDVQLFAGQTQQLTASLLPENAVATEIDWVSDHPDVVMVDGGGMLTGVAEGEALVTATARGTDFAATTTVTVANVSEETGVVISPGALTLGEGDEQTLTALLAPSLRDRTPVWKSSDEDIVTVDDEGTVSARALGEAEITATVTNADGRDFVAAVPVSVRQADYADYAIEDGVLLGYRGSRSVISIPTGVREIAEGAFAQTALTSVQIPHTVERIGDAAFAAMPVLQKVVIEDAPEEGRASRLESIGAEAFVSSQALKSIELPDSVRSMGHRVFAETLLQQIRLPENLTEVPSQAFEAVNTLTEVTFGDQVTKIGESAFSRTSSLGEVHLPESLVSIEPYAFTASGLRAVSIPESTRTIGDGAFGGAPLRSVDLGQVESVGAQAFVQTALVSVTLPASLTDVGHAAFAYNPALEEAVIGKNVGKDQLIGVFTAEGSGPATPSLERFVVAPGTAHYSERDGILYDRSGERMIAYPAAKLTGDTLTVPEGTTAIESWAVLGTRAKRLVLPEGLETIGSSAFSAAQLTELQAPRSLRTLHASAFVNNGQLARISLPGVESIGADAFAYADKLSQIEFGDQLREIGASAFAYNNSLTEFVVPDSVTKVGDSALMNSVNLTSIHFGASVAEIGTNVLTGNPKLKTLTVDPANETFFADDNVFYGREPDGLVLKLSLPTREGTEYTVVDGTVEIGSQAFRNNNSLERVVIPEGVRKLGTGAFNSASSLRDVVLPDSLESVNGFYFNSSLRELDFGTQIREFDSFWMMGTSLEHLVVRGAKGAVFHDSFGSGNVVNKTAYFGPGMKEVDVTQQTPQTIVVSGDLEKLSMSAYATPSSPVVYAPEGTPGWDAAVAGLANAGLDPATQLKPYSPLGVTLTAAGEEQAPEFTAVPQGGVTEAAGETRDYEYRFFTVDGSGTSTLARDWSTEATYSGGIAEGAVLRVEVRDITRLTATADWAAEQTAPVVVEQPVDQTARPGETARFMAKAVGSPEPTVQWQTRTADTEWADLDGATGSTLALESVSLSQSGTQVRAVFANSVGTATSEAATLTVQDNDGGGEEPGNPGEEEEPQGTPDAPVLTSDNRGQLLVTHVEGDTYQVVLPREYADTWVGTFFHGAPEFLGWTRVTGTGSYTVTIPAGTTGTHRISAVDAEGELIGWGDIRIDDPGAGGGDDGGSGSDPGNQSPQPAPSDADDPGKVAVPGGGLPRTGASMEDLGWTLIMAALLGLGGSAVLILRRRAV